MPYSGYQQDLTQLVPECLLSISEPALTDHSCQTSDSIELTSSTFALLQELDYSRNGALQHQIKQKGPSTSTEKALFVERLLHVDKNGGDIVEASDSTLITLPSYSVSSFAANDILQHHIETIPENHLLCFENINRKNNAANDRFLPKLSPINLTQIVPLQLISISNCHNTPSNAQEENKEQKALVTPSENPTFAERRVQVDCTANNVSNALSSSRLHHKDDNTTTNHLLDFEEVDPFVKKIADPALFDLFPKSNEYNSPSGLQKPYFEGHKAEDKAVHDESQITFDVTPTRNRVSGLLLCCRLCGVGDYLRERSRRCLQYNRLELDAPQM